MSMPSMTNSGQSLLRSRTVKAERHTFSDTHLRLSAMASQSRWQLLLGDFKGTDTKTDAKLYMCKHTQTHPDMDTAHTWLPNPPHTITDCSIVKWAPRNGVRLLSQGLHEANGQLNLLSEKWSCVAQLVEHGTCNTNIVGSTPDRPTQCGNVCVPYCKSLDKSVC